MAFASLCGGLALANAGLGTVHGFAAAIGGRFDIAHGAVCAALLRRRHESTSAHCVRELQRIRARPLPNARLGGDWSTGRNARHLAGLASAADEPSPRAWTIRVQDLSKDADAIVAGAARANSMRSNPLPLERGELDEILAASL